MFRPEDEKQVPLNTSSKRVHDSGWEAKSRQQSLGETVLLDGLTDGWFIIEVLMWEEVGRRLAKVELRSLSECIERMGVPSTAEELEQRVPTNLLYYQANYLLLLVFATFFTGFGSPVFFLAIAVVMIGVLWISYNDLEAQTVRVSLVGAGMLLLFTGGIRLIVYQSVALFLIAVHAVLRKRSMKARLVSWIDVQRSYTPLAVAASKLPEQINNEDKFAPREESPSMPKPSYSAKYREIEGKYRSRHAFS